MSKFSIGDKVKCISTNGYIHIQLNETYTVLNIYTMLDDGQNQIKIQINNGVCFFYPGELFVLVPKPLFMDELAQKLLDKYAEIDDLTDQHSIGYNIAISEVLGLMGYKVEKKYQLVNL